MGFGIRVWRVGVGVEEIIPLSKPYPWGVLARVEKGISKQVLAMPNLLFEMKLISFDHECWFSHTSD